MVMYMYVYSPGAGMLSMFVFFKNILNVLSF